MSSPITRRRVLGGLGGAGVSLLAACATSRPATPRPAPDSPSAASGLASEPAAQLASLEARLGGRLGVHAVDTGSGVSVAYRSDERFLMCSTSKVLTCAAILRRAERVPSLLDHIVRYPSTPIVEHSPVTGAHVTGGMTVSALCRAAITVSDNTAVNLLSGVLGGPSEVTAFVRTLGDPDTRLDRTEPDLNVTGPGDERDTTKPARMTADLRALLIGDALSPPMRDRLASWMVANTTGDRQIRAALPEGWRVGDKTGAGAHAESNDVAVVWPPGRAPLVIAVYTAPSDPASTAGVPTIAEATRIAVRALDSR